MQWEQIIYDIILALVPIVATALLALIAYGAQYVRHKYTWAQELQVVSQAEASLRTLVIEAQQTLVDEMKAAKADGKLTPAEAEHVKRKVEEAFLKQLTIEQHRILGAVTDDLTGWIGARIEQYVVEQKQTSIQAQVAALASPRSPSA